MSRNLTYKYRIVIHIMADDEWEEQELFTANEWDTLGAADVEARGVDLSRYPAGSFVYIESMSSSPWVRV